MEGSYRLGLDRLIVSFGACCMRGYASKRTCDSSQFYLSVGPSHGAGRPSRLIRMTTVMNRPTTNSGAVEIHFQRAGLQPLEGVQNDKLVHPGLLTKRDETVVQKQ